MKCEGWHRHGGAFTLGPVTWRQCKNEATVLLTVKQDGKTRTWPACNTCWENARDPQWKITIVDVKPIAAETA
jgi:hypothetical protein